MTLQVILVLVAAALAVSEASLVGGYRDVDVNDTGLQTALNYAVVKHNNDSNDMFLSQVVETVSAKSQMVSGIKYVITVKMARTNCRKGGVDEVCSVHSDPEVARPFQCTFTVWSKPWNGFLSVVEKKC